MSGHSVEGAVVGESCGARTHGDGSLGAFLLELSSVLGDSFEISLHADTQSIIVIAVMKTEKNENREEDEEEGRRKREEGGTNPQVHSSQMHFSPGSLSASSIRRRLAFNGGGGEREQV